MLPSAEGVYRARTAETKVRCLTLISFLPERPAPLIYPPTLVDTAGRAQTSVVGNYCSDKCFACSFLIAHPPHQADIGVSRTQSEHGDLMRLGAGPPRPPLEVGG